MLQLRQGLYALCDDDRKLNFSNYFLANQLYQPSFVSLESALSLYGFIPANMDLLNQAVQQTTKHRERIDRPRLIEMLTNRIEDISTQKLLSDVRPFIEDQAELEYLSKDNLLKMITQIV